MEDKQNNDKIRFHLQESEALKKQWVQNVFNIIDNLSNRLADMEKKVYEEREFVLVSLEKLKELLRQDMNTGDAEVLKALKILEERVDKFISDTKNKFSKVNFGITEEVKELDDCLDTTNITLATVKTKVGIYSAITSLIIIGITSIIGTTLAVVFKDAIKAWWGG